MVIVKLWVLLGNFDYFSCGLVFVLFVFMILLIWGVVSGCLLVIEVDVRLKDGSLGSVVYGLGEVVMVSFFV